MTLSPVEYRTAAAACERILPRDDDPGAIDLGVPEYIDRALAPASVSEWRSVFRAGLARLNAESRARFGQSFYLATAEEQAEQLLLWQQGDDDARKFFELLKALTFEGAFGDPCHGGNRGGQGFHLIGWKPDRVSAREN